MPHDAIRAVRRPRAPQRTLYLLVTCEHGGNRIPARYRAWFAGHGALLASHRGYDPGALATARRMAAVTGGHLIATTVSRLLVELNRSPHNPRVFSALIRRAPLDVRREIFERYYVPHHRAVAAEVEAAIARGHRVLHIGSHSFTPNLDGVARSADIGLLYDPARALERRFAGLWLEALRAHGAGIVRRNYPYEGRNDGLPTVLRRRFAPQDYVGLELEVNQRHPLAGGGAWLKLQDAIVAALMEALTRFERAAPAVTPRRVAQGSAPRSRAARPTPGFRATTRAGH